MIKNLSQLKKALVKGAEFEFVRHCQPNLIGECRRVNCVKTTGIYSIVPDEPDNKATLANNGLGMWLAWDKASFWEFEDGTCTLYDNAEEHTERHIIFAIKVKEA